MINVEYACPAAFVDMYVNDRIEQKPYCS